MTKLSIKSGRAAALFAAYLLTLSMVNTTSVRADDPPKSWLDNFSFDGSLRAREEVAGWFNPADPKIDPNYQFGHTKLQLGAHYKTENLHAYAQGQYFQLYGLPDDANGPGSVYYTTNGNHKDPGDFSLRQGFLSYSDRDPSMHYDATAGRFFYANGGEVVTENKLLESVKQRRIYNRLIGTFDFTGGRSFDGGKATYGTSNLGHISLAAMRPTQGGFATDSMAEIQDIDLVTGAYTSSADNWPGQGELQIFYYFYHDDRGSSVIKTDNRPLDARKADGEAIELSNFGAHWIQIYEGSGFKADSLLWGDLQGGRWGSEDVLAGAFAIEGGLRFAETYMTPSVRVGYNWGSGDSNPADGDHNTFFQMLPTARQYAMTPFFNEMNNEDLFIQGSIQPDEKWNITSNLHYLWLQNKNDLLYSGGGANKSRDQFGYAGTSLKGDEIGTLMDITVSYDLCKYLTTSIYYGHLFGAGGVNGAFSSGDLDYGFVELTAKM